jgi:hypothetical protein
MFALTAVIGLSTSPMLSSDNPRSKLKRHWKETDSETLWTVRYTNCDYGYYLLLRPGVVAHGSLPPNPNHGVIVPLEDVAKTTYSLGEKKRYVFVDATYDATDTAESSSSGEKRRVARSSLKDGYSAKLAGLPAVASLRIESTPQGKSIDESTVALRSGIVYTVGLRTEEIYRNEDELQYRRILAGFHWLRLPKGECSNG